MEIVLVRHGRPTALVGTLISGRDLGTWLAGFNQAGLAEAAAPPLRLQELVKAAGFVLASDVVRSIESAKLLPSGSVRIDPDLREAVLPSSMGVAIRLPAAAWVVIARMAWWLNWCRSEEPIAAARARARRAADRLCALASQHGTVAVIGHGVFNRFIARQLLARGWRGPRIMASAHWAASRFTHV
jgi:broad specificity phosphatase PhoE